MFNRGIFVKRLSWGIASALLLFFVFHSINLDHEHPGESAQPHTEQHVHVDIQAVLHGADRKSLLASLLFSVFFLLVISRSTAIKTAALKLYRNRMQVNALGFSSPPTRLELAFQKGILNPKLY